MIRNANSRRGEIRSGGAAAALIIVAGAVVAFAMLCSVKPAVGRAARAGNYCG
jgi:hypothetical protein